MFILVQNIELVDRRFKWQFTWKKAELKEGLEIQASVYFLAPRKIKAVVV